MLALAQRPWPSCPPLPYTTLFRSVEAGQSATEDAGSDTTVEAAGKSVLPGWIDVHTHFGAPGIVMSEAVDQEIDQKITRLNSSHLGISYAVFCVKKKNGPHV